MRGIITKDRQCSHVRRVGLALSVSECKYTFFSNELVRFVVGVVRVSKSSIFSKFELQELMSILSFVSNAIVVDLHLPSIR